MKTTKRNAGKPALKAPPTLAEIADALEVTVRTISTWKRQNMPTHSIKAAQAWREEQAGDDTVVELRKRRIALLRQQERRAKIDADERQGLLLPKAEVEEREARIGFAIKAVFKVLESEIPQLCLGLPLERSRPICRDRIREIQTNLSKSDSEFWPAKITT